MIFPVPPPSPVVPLILKVAPPSPVVPLILTVPPPSPVVPLILMVPPPSPVVPLILTVPPPSPVVPLILMVPPPSPVVPLILMVPPAVPVVPDAVPLSLVPLTTCVCVADRPSVDASERDLTILDVDIPLSYNKLPGEPGLLYPWVWFAELLREVTLIACAWESLNECLWEAESVSLNACE